ncbi:MAG: ectoine/hydroxyectoine ABC transporter substrate-binding protein EhuB [Burkholderiales bacterium]|jgi:polar amino acid transport system substrate-binding protein
MLPKLLRSAIIAVAVMLAACSQESGDSDSTSKDSVTLDDARKAGVIKVGFANEAPYAYLDSSTNELTGEAPAIARVILKRLGVDEVEGVLTEFGSLIPGLQAKRFDIIAAGMYILPERCKQVTFSNPTYGIGEAFLVMSGNPKNLHSYEGLAGNADATLGVVAGTVERGYARKTNIPDERVQVFPDGPSAVAGVAAGRIDAYAGTSLTIQDIVSKTTDGTLERAKPFTDPVIDGKSVRGYGAFAFRKADQSLVDAFNRELANFIGSAEHRELVKPFGFTEQELPGDVTAAQLCAG